MAAKWDFDNVHSSITFSVRHLIVSKVRGRFTKWSGSLRFDEKNLASSSADIQIDLASVDTNEAQRDTHLRSGDFFEVEKFPYMTFKSTRVVKTTGGFDVEGDLTLRGVSKPVVLNVEYNGSMTDPWGKERAGFTAKATIDRKDFGVSYNQVLDKGGVALGEKVEISIDIEATKAVEASVVENAVAAS